MKAEITRGDAIAGFLYNPITGELNNSKGDECGSVSHNGYLRIWVKGRTMAAQRLIWLYMTGELPAGDIDHITSRQVVIFADEQLPGEIFAATVQDIAFMPAHSGDADMIDLVAAHAEAVVRVVAEEVLNRDVHVEMR